MSAVIMRIFAGASVGVFTETAWDSFMEDFKTIVDLAETLTALNPALSQPSSRWPSESPAPPTPGPSQSSPPSTRERPIAPNPTASPSPLPTGPSASVFAQDPMSSLPPASRPSPPLTPSTKNDGLCSQTAYFSPSFELSPLVPLFVVSARCRDPVLRRRAISLLLSSRRREGCWDSFGAGMCALQAMRYEEDIPEGMGLEADSDRGGIWTMNPDITGAQDIPEERRVRNIFVSVKVVEGVIETGYQLTTGKVLSETVVFERKMVRHATTAADEGRGPGLLFPESWSKSRS